MEIILVYLYSIDGQLRHSMIKGTSTLKTSQRECVSEPGSIVRLVGLKIAVLMFPLGLVPGL